MRKIINHHIDGGTRESHPRVQDLQHPRLGKPRRVLQIFYTRMGFPRPSINVVLDSINPDILISSKMKIPFISPSFIQGICFSYLVDLDTGILVHLYPTSITDTCSYYDSCSYLATKFVRDKNKDLLL